MRLNEDGDLYFNYYGRGFTLRDLKRSIIAASGSKLSSYLLACEERLLSDVIEDIELVGELLQAKSTTAPIEEAFQ